MKSMLRVLAAACLLAACAADNIAAPTEAGCPGGAAALCVRLCPSEPRAYQVCVAECVSRCGDAVPLVWVGDRFWSYPPTTEQREWATSSDPTTPNDRVERPPPTKAAPDGACAQAAGLGKPLPGDPCGKITTEEECVPQIACAWTTPARRRLQGDPQSQAAASQCLVSQVHEYLATMESFDARLSAAEALETTIVSNTGRIGALESTLGLGAGGGGGEGDIVSRLQFLENYLQFELSPPQWSTEGLSSASAGMWSMANGGTEVRRGGSHEWESIGLDDYITAGRRKYRVTQYFGHSDRNTRIGAIRRGFTNWDTTIDDRGGPDGWCLQTNEGEDSGCLYVRETGAGGTYSGTHPVGSWVGDSNLCASDGEAWLVTIDADERYVKFEKEDLPGWHITWSDLDFGEGVALGISAHYTGDRYQVAYTSFQDQRFSGLAPLE